MVFGLWTHPTSPEVQNLIAVSVEQFANDTLMKKGTTSDPADQSLSTVGQRIELRIREADRGETRFAKLKIGQGGRVAEEPKCQADVLAEASLAKKKRAEFLKNEDPGWAEIQTSFFTLP